MSYLYTAKRICLLGSFAVTFSTQSKAQDSQPVSPNSEESEEKSVIEDDAREEDEKETETESSQVEEEDAEAEPTEETPRDKERTKTKKKLEVKRSSRDNRKESHVSIFYLPLNLGLILPTKSGFAATWIIHEEISAELEYISGNYGLGFLNADLVSLSERLTNARLRWYPGNSFNLFAGFGERSYRFSLGSDVLTKITDYNFAALPSLEVENQTFSMGIGNRWQFDNGITLGLDWFEWVLPIGEGKIDDQITGRINDESYRKRVTQVLNYMRYGSTVNAIKIQLGYSF